MNPRRLLARISSGDLANVDFDDARRLVVGLGFELIRTTGSHHVFVHPRIPELINLQEVRGQVKPYQLRQLLSLLNRYDLTLEDR